MLWLDHVRAGTEISKKLTLNPNLSAKNAPLFLLSDMRRSLKIFARGMPYMLMYSALHIMQWFSHSLDMLTPKIRRKICDLNIFYESKQMSVTQDLKWSLEQRSALQV